MRLAFLLLSDLLLERLQPQAHVQVLINIIDFGMNLQEAGDAPRVLHTGSSQPTGEVMQEGGWVHLEEGFSDKCRNVLKQKERMSMSSLLPTAVLGRTRLWLTSGKSPPRCRVLTETLRP